LPVDFERQLADVQIDQARRSIDASMNHADEATRRFFEKIRAKRSLAEGEPANEEEIKELLKRARDRITDAKKKLERLLTRIPDKKLDIYGLLASTEKRQAEILFSTTQSTLKGDLLAERVRKQELKASIELLRKAMGYYWDTFLLDRSGSWALVQYLSLTLVLNRLRLETNQPNTADAAPANEEGTEKKDAAPAKEEGTEKKLPALWSMAVTLSKYDLRSPERARAKWAHSNLIELYLLALIFSPRQEAAHEDLPNPAEARKQALEYTDAFIELAGRNSFSVYSTRRQMVRYIEWFGKIAELGPLPGLAEEIFEKFPDEVEEAWK
jgi:hypothetical protein